jgi:hypothetical protein
MKKPKYLKTVCCPLTNEMFEKIIKITNEREIAISEFIRESIELKLSMEDSKNGKASV